MTIKQMDENTRKTAAVGAVYLLVIRESKDGAVIRHPQYPEKRCVLFTDDPKTLEVINDGEFTNPFFEALSLPPKMGAELMRKAVTDGLDPLFATFEKDGEVVVGFIGDVRVHYAENV